MGMLGLAFICLLGAVQGQSLKPVFPQALGWAVVIGFGTLMTLVTLAMSWADKKFFQAKSGVEATYTAGREVSLGLTATVVVSQATWAATLLQSANQAWMVGVSGPYWYAAASTVEIVTFAAIAIEVKRKSPNMHTFCEFMRVRHDPGLRGKKPQKFHHLTFVFFGILTSSVVTALLILGGAATVHLLTGMSLEAAAFLLPISVIAYTVVGGLKATFLASYLHTGIVFIILWVLCIHTYAFSDEIGSVPVMFNLLERASAITPDENGIVWSNYPPEAEPHQIQGTASLATNSGNSYLTMGSDIGLILGMNNIILTLCVIFMDQSYFQSAIAARPSVAVSGFIMGGLVWYAIPFTMGTTFGLAARALQIPITELQANSGLVPAIVIVELLGDGAGVGLIIMLFMAITSTGSAELIAVSSLLTYDIFLEYIPYGKRMKNTLETTCRESFMNDNPRGDDYENSPEHFMHEKTAGKLLTITRIFTLVFGIVMGVLALILNNLGVTLGWVYFVMVLLISGGVIPMCLSYFWYKARNWACSLGAVFGFIMAVMSWFLFAQHKFNVIAVGPLGDPEVCFYASCVGIGTSSMISIVGSAIFPDNFDWDLTITKIMRTDESAQEELTPEEKDPKFLAREVTKARIASVVLFLIFIIIWPMPMYGTGYIFSEAFFTFWVVLSLIWAIVGGLLVILFPIWEFIRNRRLAKETLDNIDMHVMRDKSSPHNPVAVVYHDDSSSDSSSFEDI